jgi:uncharacterized protein (DUF2147 family)
MIKSIPTLTILFVTFVSWSYGVSPIGKWKTIDDTTGEARSIINIWEKDGEIFGSIESLFRKPHENPNPLCTKCDGDLRNKPVIGLTILRNLKQDENEWNGGTVLDPEDGNTYKCKIEVVEGGTKLKVRGFIAVSLLGRTQYWHSAE